MSSKHPVLPAPGYLNLRSEGFSAAQCFSSHLQYTGSVDENTHDVVVMRIKAQDKDLEHTDNWLTIFTIAKGNEDHLFSIETDEETNEGILKLIKVLRLL